MKTKLFTCTKTSGDDETASATITTATPDRDRDVIDPAGIDVRAFRRNPVVLAAHDHRGVPIGRATKIERTANGLRASWNWNPHANLAWRDSWNAGFLNATSIGFRALKFEPSKDPARAGGFDFNKIELLEFSVVPVPANAEALRGLKAFGLEPVEDPDALYAELFGEDDEDGDRVEVPQALYDEVTGRADSETDDPVVAALAELLTGPGERIEVPDDVAAEVLRDLRDAEWLDRLFGDRDAIEVDADVYREVTGRDWRDDLARRLPPGLLRRR